MLSVVANDVTLLPHVLDHYARVAPLLEPHFAGTPIVFANFPSGFANPPHYHVTDVPLTENKLLWCVHRYYAIEFHTWAPLPSDETRLQFARILLERGDSFERTKEAALALRATLFESHIEAIPLVDGTSGIALWIPLADAPQADVARAWLHTIAATAVARHPALLTTEPNTRDPHRVHVHVSSNARGHYSAMPYSLRGRDDLPMCTPIAWEELGAVDAIAATAHTFPARLKTHGDVFAAQLAPIAAQTLPPAAPAIFALPHTGHTPEPRGRIINAAIAILSDGGSLTADDLCAQAIKRGLIPAQTQRKYVYSALIEYIARAMGRGRKPPIVQDEQRRFRINETPDDWPDLVPPAQPAPDAQAQALCDRLESTGSGDDPAAFETAVCDAFAHLGFLTQHLGGHGQPDGVADAILGPLGYRIAIECKTAKTIVTQPDCAEAAREVGELAAQYGVLVGPAFSDETDLLSELQTHKITALTVADLQTLLHLAATPLDVQTILVPGYAADVVPDLLWQRRHGAAKRVATVARIVQTEGWKAQQTAAEQGGPANAPHLTLDAAMLLVDASLRAAGSTESCTREEVQSAFAYLTNPIIAKAASSGDAIVIVTAE